MSNKCFWGCIGNSLFRFVKNSKKFLLPHDSWLNLLISTDNVTLLWFALSVLGKSGYCKQIIKIYVSPLDYLQSLQQQWKSHNIISWYHTSYSNFASPTHTHIKFLYEFACLVGVICFPRKLLVNRFTAINSLRYQIVCCI